MYSYGAAARAPGMTKLTSNSVARAGWHRRVFRGGALRGRGLLASANAKRHSRVTDALHHCVGARQRRAAATSSPQACHSRIIA
jgi:hypothetical protein